MACKGTEVRLTKRTVVGSSYLPCRKGAAHVLDVLPRVSTRTGWPSPCIRKLSTPTTPLTDAWRYGVNTRTGWPRRCIRKLSTPTTSLTDAWRYGVNTRTGWPRRCIRKLFTPTTPLTDAWRNGVSTWTEARLPSPSNASECKVVT